MQGVLLVDKPATWTSFDVVNYVRRIVAQAEGKKPKHVKVGHTGTLDPFATGLLVLLVGKDYTKRAGELTKLDKTYQVAMRLGAVSTTGDPEGEITPVSEAVPTSPELEAALENFRGEIEQTPPAFSAIKVDGQRAYKLARAGKEVVLEPRKVTISRLELGQYAYPDVKFVAEVSSGTYIRTLVEDIGQKLRVGAYTTELRRTKVGTFEIENAQPVKELNSERIASNLLTNMI
jgi:tRNA pseudouridine55 synthase